MQYPVHARGFEGRQLVLETPGLFSSAKLLLDGRPAPKGPRRGQFLLRRLDGTEAIAKSLNTFFDPVPQVMIDNEIVKVVEPLKWYQWIWAGLPILLIFVGGALGAVLGLMATGLNARIFRSELNRMMQYLAVAAVSVMAVVIYFILVVTLTSAIR